MTDKDAMDLILTHAIPGTPPHRESVDDALMIVESYGPWGADLNDAHRRQIVLADEVKTLRTQLAHWKTFAKHAEGERSAWNRHATAQDAQLLAMRAALRDALHQNEHDMLMTGEELRACRAALGAQP